MDTYVVYSLIAAGDSHSDYALQVQEVCRKKSREFTMAAEKLAERDREWLSQRIFDIQRCSARLPP